jgi:hypothetical protein
MKRIAGMVIVAAAVVSARCGETLDTPTAPTTTATSTTTHFVGSLGVGGTRFFSFTVSEAGTVTALLASITSPQTGAVAETALGLGLGQPAGPGCALLTSVTTTASLIAQLQGAAGPGIYCINVYDVGTLSSDVNFAVRFSYP